jgi:PAS domain S-box-containing protein
MMPLRVHAKFLVLVLGILVLFLGTFSVVMVRRESRILARKGAEKEQLVAQAIFSDLKENMLAGRPRSTLTLLRTIEGTNGIVCAAVLRPDGTPAFGMAGPKVVLPQLAEAVATGRNVDLNDLTGAVPLHINLFPLKNEAVCRQCHAKFGDILGVVMLSHSIEDTVREIRSSTRNLLGLLLTLMAVMSAALYLAVRKVVLGPLRTLHQGAEVIGKGDLAQRIHIGSGDEFQDLAFSFNEMAGRLKETYIGLENTVKVRTAELNESVRLMRGILSSMSSGVALLGGDGTVKLMNRQGAWILGRGHEDLLGTKLDEIVPETRAFLDARVGTYEEFTVQTPDGISTPVGFTASHYSGEGEQEGLIVVFQDLTELKSLQAELVGKERFAAVGRVVAGVAHEIRNPLFAISAIGQIFERDLADPGQRELVRALLAETKRLNELVEELLVYGRPMKLRPQEADLWELWQDVLDLSWGELERRGIRLAGDDPLRHPVAFFDPHQVRQVLLNVLRNAMESMQDGGTLTVTMVLEDHALLFRIADTGAGVPAEQLVHVFDLFFTTKPKGTGLGLPICRKIMRDHGGDIFLSSEEGRGTTVTLRLPYRSTVGGVAAGAPQAAK